MGVGSYGQAPRPQGGHKKKGKKSGHHGLGGFIGNLVDDVQETATGLVPGLVHTGKAIVHDAGHAVGLSDGPYQTDDIAKAIVHSYTDRGTFWGELGRGHVSRAGHALYENPLGPMLDVASIITGGGSLAGKLAAKGGAEASLLHRVENAAGHGFDRKLSQNLAIQGRQRLFEKLSESVPHDAPIIGRDRRVARHDRRLEITKVKHEQAKTMRPLREALTGLHGIRRRAVAVLAGGHNIDDLMKFYAVRHKALEGEIKHKKSRNSTEIRETASGLEYDREPGTSLVLRDNGRAERAGVDEEIAYEDGDLSALRDADVRDSLKTNQRNLARIKKRLAELEQIKRKVDLDNPDPKLAKAVAAARELSDVTTKRLIERGLDPEAAANRAALESRIMREAGVTEHVYGGAIRSHVNVTPDKLDVPGARATLKHTKPGELAEAKKNTGYSMWNAKDSLDPSMYLHSARQVFEHKARLDRFAKVLEGAKWVSPEDAQHLKSGEWKIIEAGSTVRKDIDDVYGLLVDAEAIFEGVPGYHEMKRAIEASLVRDGAHDLVPVVPKAYYDELVGEFTAASTFVRRMIDNPTRVWRALTLNMRPAWIVNNFVGQMMLLAVSHGVRGLKNYVMQFGKKGKLADELVPELVDFGWAHESLADLKGLGGNKVTRGMRRVSDFMGNLNAKLTDDHTRKAAWLSEMEPHVAKLQKAHPGMSFEDAARQLWSNEHFADEITQRVLSDMVDFGDLSNFERKVIKRAIPFYAWIKGISKRTGRLVADEPWKAVVGHKLGAIGQQAVAEEYGDVPMFLRGMVGLGGNRIAVTQGLNPFVTPADVVGMLSGAVLPGRMNGPQNPLAQINPLFKAPLEALTNRDFFYGNQLDSPYDEQRSFLRRTAGQGIGSLAQVRLAQQIKTAQDAKHGGLDYTPMFDPSVRNAVLSYLGVPLRDLNRDAALARARKDAGQ